METPKIVFPQQHYLIKIIGDNAEGFCLQEYVVEVMGRHIYDWDSANLEVRHSGKGKYASVTIYCNIQSLDQLQVLCADLKNHSCVRMVL